MQFGNLSGATISSDSTAIYTFYELPGEPWLRVKPGGDLNRPYFAEVLATQSKSRKRLMKGKIDMDMLDHNRVLDRKLYPKYLDAGAWGGWIDDESGEAVEYSQQGFKELCEQLPADLFDELRAFCNEPANFRADEAPDADDVEDTAKN